MVQLTGGQAIVQSLKAYGVETIFGLPGAQLDNIFDALYEERANIRVIHTRHEQTTAYMAFGYAQATGKVGVCLVVPGPGLLNAGAGLCTAYATNAPVLCIAGQIASDQIDAGIGAPSHAAAAMEMGYDAVLLNTAVARAHDPVRMASAFAAAIEAGRAAYEAGLIEPSERAKPSTPVAGTPFFDLDTPQKPGPTRG